MKQSTICFKHSCGTKPTNKELTASIRKTAAAEGAKDQVSMVEVKNAYLKRNIKVLAGTVKRAHKLLEQQDLKPRKKFPRPELR